MASHSKADTIEIIDEFRVSGLSLPSFNLRYPGGDQVSGLAGSQRRARVGKRAGAGVQSIYFCGVDLFKVTCINLSYRIGDLFGERSLFCLGGRDWCEAFGLDAALAGQLGVEGSIEPWRLWSKEGHGVVFVSCA